MVGKRQTEDWYARGAEGGALRRMGVKELSEGRDGGSITNWIGCRVFATRSNRVGGVY